MSCAGEPVAVLAMMHGEKHAQVVSNVLQYTTSRRPDKAWRGKMLGTLGMDRNEEGEDPSFVRLKSSCGCSIHFYQGYKIFYFLKFHVHHGMSDNKSPTGIYKYNFP